MEERKGTEEVKEGKDFDGSEESEEFEESVKREESDKMNPKSWRRNLRRRRSRRT